MEMKEKTSNLEKQLISSPYLHSIIRFDFRDSKMTEEEIQDKDINKNEHYNYTCLDFLKHNDFHDYIENINFYIPACTLSEEKENHLVEYLKKFQHEEDFFAFDYCGIIDKKQEVYCDYNGTDVKEKSFYKIRMSLSKYDEMVKAVDKDDLLSKVKYQNNWNLVNLLAIKASYPFRMYNNNNFKDFEPIFDLVSKDLPFLDALGLASIVMFRIQDGNISTNYAFPYSPCFGHFDNAMDILVITKRMGTTNAGLGNIQCIFEYHKTDKEQTDLQNLGTKMYNAINVNTTNWRKYLNGTNPDFPQSTHFVSLMTDYKDYVSRVKEQNKVFAQEFLKGK